MIYKIFDAHIHMNVNSIDGVNAFLELQHKFGVSEGIVMIDPFLKEFKCPNGENHYVCIRPKSNKNDELYCTICQKKIGSAENIFRESNIQLIKKIEELNTLHQTSYYPFITVGASSRMIVEESTYFDEHFNDGYFGLKIYTGLSFEILNRVSYNSKKPLLIHTALRYENQHPRNMLNFLLDYEGPVLMAHFARFDRETIKILKRKKNIYFDTSPASLLFDTFYKKKQGNDGIYNKEDIYYRAIDLIGTDKLIWGSDFPFGKMEEELYLLENITLTSEERMNICYNNAKRFLGK